MSGTTISPSCRSTSEQRIIINASKMSLSKSLGVIRFLAGAASSIRGDSHFDFVVDSRADFEASALGGVFQSSCDRVTLTADFRVASVSDATVEIVAHHFLKPLSQLPTVQIFHDFHVFTVPEKYGNPSKSQQSIRDNYRNCSAAITHFPYTYFMFDDYLQEGAAKLFLMPSPLMLSPSKIESPAGSVLNERERPAHPKQLSLFYPAQLQYHKNHRALFEAVGKLRRDWDVKCVLCGSEFNDVETARIFGEIHEFEVAQFVEYLGVVDEDTLCRLFSESDVTVVPSLAEGGAYVALEALACGGRVACSQIEQAVMHLDAAGVSSDVSFFDPRSADDMATAIVKARGYEGRFASSTRFDTWEDYGVSLQRVIDFVTGQSDRPIVRIDGSGKYRGFAEASLQ